MCFRPADASAAGPSACPSCGKTIQSMGGIALKKCPFCGVEFPEAPASPKPAASASPAAPSAPKAPGAPAAPSAPKDPR
ncbi:hypothetical protein [Raoultibacter phocaeensis]|uniref:hypothetical protein n=1 Tax=Raoultibacter phocaeensis TaxID=2479841 RepID=UPI00111BB059|nr:hypothetical protein [Raoultibacter phocaeensis]